MDETTQFVSLCVLASGSAGNCSVLRVGPGPAQQNGQGAGAGCGDAEGSRLVLIDAGLSPRRTRRMLEAMELSLDQLEAIVLTHLDTDHWYAGWQKKLPAGVRIWAHKKHAVRGRRRGLLPASVRGFEREFQFEGICPSVARVSAVLASHDDAGVASFRFHFNRVVPDRAGHAGPGPANGGGLAGTTATLGFATDLGRVRYELVEHLRGVDVLAIESNYCPELQMASSRPWFLKRRIMGGSGHLSNDEALEAVRQIQPASHVVLLHLSRECNSPDLVATLHRDAPYCCTITSQSEPTPWVHISGGVHSGVGPSVPPVREPSLFGDGCRQGEPGGTRMGVG